MLNVLLLLVNVATASSAYNMDCIESNPMQFAYHNSCFLTTEKNVKCFGEDDNKLVTDAPTNGPFNMLAAGHSNYCVIRSADQGLTCWGKDYHKVVTDTPKTGKFSSVSCGANHCCAIYSTSKAIKCWGGDYQDQVSTAPTSGTYNRIFARGTYNAAISSTGDLTIWGHPKHIKSLISYAPAPGTYTQLSLGLYHMCAILSEDQTIKCWGNNQYKNISESPLGKFIQISVGGYYSCAIAIDHSIQCWGSNDLHNPISDAPTTGSYSLMYSGYYHACALETSGDKYTCWGWDKHGEVSEPMKANVNIALPSTCGGSCVEEKAKIMELEAEVALWKARFEAVENLEVNVFNNRHSAQAMAQFPDPENEVGNNLVSADSFANLFKFTMFLGVTGAVFGLGRMLGRKSSKTAVYTEMSQMQD